VVGRKGDPEELWRHRFRSRALSSSSNLWPGRYE